MNLVTAISGLCAALYPAFITDQFLPIFFGEQAASIKESFLNPDKHGQYQLKEPFNTQRKVEQYFAALESNAENEKIKQGLFDLLSNVILFEKEGSNGTQFHFRFGNGNDYLFPQPGVEYPAATERPLRKLFLPATGLVIGRMKP